MSATSMSPVLETQGFNHLVEVLRVILERSFNLDESIESISASHGLGGHFSTILPNNSVELNFESTIFLTSITRC